MRKSRKRKRLTPGLGKLRSARPRLPGRRKRDPVAIVAELEPVTRVTMPVLGARREAKEEPPEQTGYDPEYQRLSDAVLALGERVDVVAKTVPPAPPDYSGEIQQVSDAVLALGDRVDGMARRQDEIP